MGGNWIDECNELLKRIRKSAETDNPDRLELVRSMHTALHAINHSTLGWLQYVNNPDVMSMFDRSELQEIHATLNRIAEAYLLHDIEVTERGMEKGLGRTIKKEVPGHLYV
ncbi:MAG: DUF2153 family protein [Candidatus Bathyarchaeota archaeon]|jgi:hypothetical protein